MEPEKYIAAAEKHRETALKAERHIWRNPETGYREWKTSAYLADIFEKFGYKLMKADGIPGFYTDIDTGRPGPKLLIFGELDSLICCDHPDADPVTGAVHACGHNAQAATLAGIAGALKEEGILDGLCGSIRLCAVPAEELIETGFRENLRREGKIKYYGGKTEFLYRGYLDGCDIAFMVHTGGGSNTMGIVKGGNGCVVKNTVFKGKASHAGGSPDKGINALYIANVAFSAANALRETFPDDKYVRFHPIITKGGEAVNAIPAEVKTESYVRGADIQIISAINKKINRAFAGSAAAIGGNVHIEDRAGYSPLSNDKNLSKAGYKCMKYIIPKENCYLLDQWDTGCTDMGDISCVIPAAHFYCSGASGTGHGNDYKISNPIEACVNSMKFHLLLISELMCNEAAEAKNIIKKAKLPYKNKEEFFKEIDKNNMDKDAVIYNEDGTVTLTF